MSDKMTISEIRESLPLSMDIVRGYGIEIKPNGFFRCPFHSDKTPSAHLWKTEDGKVIVKCFSCGYSGSIIDFIQKMDGCDLKTALEKFGFGNARIPARELLRRYQAQRKKNKTEEERQQLLDRIKALEEDVRLINELIRSLWPSSPDEEVSDASVEACDRLNKLERDLESTWDEFLSFEENHRGH